MNLLNLAPDIQEAILFLPEVTSGKPPITERHLRPIAAELSWARQRSAWGRVVGAIITRYDLSDFLGLLGTRFTAIERGTYKSSPQLLLPFRFRVR
jgi:hypothetical protein